MIAFKHQSFFLGGSFIQRTSLLQNSQKLGSLLSFLGSFAYHFFTNLGTYGSNPTFIFVSKNEFRILFIDTGLHPKFQHYGI